MKILAVCIVLLGFIAFWSGRVDRTDREEAQADSLALNYAIFRNAAFAHAQKVKTEGTFTPGNLVLPSGWVGSRAWQGLIQKESGLLYCYAYGPARPEEVIAIQKLFRGSKAVGWNNGGIFARDGTPIALPAAIPHGNVVSVIRID